MSEHLCILCDEPTENTTDDLHFNGSYYVSDIMQLGQGFDCCLACCLSNIEYAGYLSAKHALEFLSRETHEN